MDGLDTHTTAVDLKPHSSVKIFMLHNANFANNDSGVEQQCMLNAILPQFIDKNKKSGNKHSNQTRNRLPVPINRTETVHQF